MNFDLNFYWALLLRRLPVMAIFVLLFSGLGLITAVKLPETYSTSARLLLESPQIPSTMVNSIVQAGAAEQLDAIQQRLMTRANLIDIAHRFSVFEDIGELEPDTVAARMREATKISRRGGNRGETSMTMVLSFEARAPQVAASVVNEYVTLVLQENSKFRVGRAENTLEFFEQEVNQLDEELTRQSVEIARFKSENANALPQDQAFRLGRQSLLQERLERLSRDLALAVQQRDNLESTFASTRSAASEKLGKAEEELTLLQAEYKRLIDTYSENNPRTIRVKDRIASLEAIVATQASESEQVNDREDVQALLDSALNEANSKIVAFESQIETTTREMDELRKNISLSVANATQLAEFERDFEIIQARYNSAVSNLHSARMSERVESTAQGQRINVIENASIPQIPSGPNRILIAAIGITIGLGLAVGYYALLEVVNWNVRRPQELRDRFDVSPIATIPYMESRAERILRRSALVLTMLVVLIGVPIALWYVDTSYLPLETIVQKGLAKLGLG